MQKFGFRVLSQEGLKREGEMITPHGRVKTPVFMPVGTRGSVKAMSWEDMRGLGVEIILGNTYHLHLRPGEDLIAEMGGLQKWSGWNGPMLTDSGGFQVWSLGQLRDSRGRKMVKIEEEGVRFKSHLDGSWHEFTPESAIEIQRKLGADIIMILDQCTGDEVSWEEAKEAMERTHRWAERAKQYWEKHGRLSEQGKYQALFGIIQGGKYEDLRKESARFMVEMDFDGIAIGGESIGYNMDRTKKIISWLRELLPKNKPLYTMGVGGNPGDVKEMVELGVDMMDCVAPTRQARNGALFHPDYPKWRLNIGKAEFAKDERVIYEGCGCAVCRAGYSRSYLHHLYRVRELSYYRYASIHNLWMMVNGVDG